MVFSPTNGTRLMVAGRYQTLPVLALMWISLQCSKRKPCQFFRELDVI